MSEGERTEADKAIRSNLLRDSRLLAARKVTAYLPMSDEPDLRPLMDELVERDVKVFVPKIVGDDIEMIAYQRGTECAVNSLGIVEPIEGEQTIEADVYLVPMVAYHGLDRLGHGKGYYDRYLAGKSGYKIGVAYAVQREAFEAQAHDVPMDKVVTEEEICE